MPKRSEKRDAAKAEYIARKARGEAAGLRELAEDMGVNYQTLRNWKTKDAWDKALPKRKRGGQPGNQNSRGRQNAKGPHPGAPEGNRNAEKDGAYSAIYLDRLTQAERDEMERTPLEAKAAFEQEMRLLKLRENRILAKIADYEEAEPESLYLTSTITGDMDMENRDSAFVRVLKLQEALYKVQGRIARVADSLRAIEDGEKRLKLERERLDILRIRATGAVDVPGPEEEDLEAGRLKNGDLGGGGL